MAEKDLIPIEGFIRAVREAQEAAMKNSQRADRVTLHEKEATEETTPRHVRTRLVMSTPIVFGRPVNREFNPTMEAVHGQTKA